MSEEQTAHWDRYDPLVWANKRKAAREHAKQLRKEVANLGCNKQREHRASRHNVEEQHRPAWKYTESPEPGMFRESRNSANVPGDAVRPLPRPRQNKAKQSRHNSEINCLDWDPMLSQVLELHAHQCKQQEIIDKQLVAMEEIETPETALPKPRLCRTCGLPAKSPSRSKARRGFGGGRGNKGQSLSNS
jgi:hypothetical protein